MTDPPRGPQLLYATIVRRGGYPVVMTSVDSRRISPRHRCLAHDSDDQC